jgi:hypothetical protein
MSLDYTLAWCVDGPVVPWSQTGNGEALDGW